MAVAAQFLYVAAQAGIFSFFINYMTAEVPTIPPAWRTGMASKWIEIQTTFPADGIKDLPALINKLKEKSDPVSAFLSSQLSGETTTALADYKEATSESKPIRLALVQELNRLVKQDPTRVKPEQLLYDAQRFNAVTLGAKTQQILADKAQKKEISLPQLNRQLLQDAYPKELPFNDSILSVSDKGASFLASVGFFCFLIGRFTGAGLLKKFSAHKVLGLYGLMNVVCCALIFLKLGWLSVLCVFLSYFFMSIMFPTIFALGIFGLGARAKKASAYIVMAIMGGAILPKLMGYVADQFDMSRGFIVPLVCFVFVAFYGFNWPKFSHAESLSGVKTAGGH